MRPEMTQAQRLAADQRARQEEGAADRHTPNLSMSIGEVNNNDMSASIPDTFYCVYRSKPMGSLRARADGRQWWNSRSPEKVITIPCSSAAASTSSMRVDPPGCQT